MLDDLRNSSSFIDDEEPPHEPEPPRRRSTRRQANGVFMGMTAPQRFVLSLMLFFMVCLLGVLALVASGSIVIPGF